MAIGPVRTPTPLAIGPAIGHVRAYHSRRKVAVSFVITMTRLTVERSSDLATVDRTMMDASLA